MPKIEVHQKQFFSLLGRSYTDAELEAIFPAAKAELDEPVNADGIVKIELNDTNRPDLWSTAGLARLLRIRRGEPAPDYRFLSDSTHKLETGKRVIEVDPSVAKIRPYVVAFAAVGKPISPETLADLIQTQEKLCRGFGQKRKTIAMGIYRSDLITFPVKYRAADPKTTRFVPLGADREKSLEEILKDHPKGQEYAHLLEGLSAHPYLEDSAGKTLSYPPIINSAEIGAVVAGDERLIVEMTGTELNPLLLAASIVACDMADLGFEILPMAIEYPKDYPAELPYGSTLTVPYYFQKPQSTSLAAINKLLGVKLTAAEVAEALKLMGNNVEVQGDAVTVKPAPYRNDFLHAVDVIEDVMIGRGMDSFEAEMPRDFTVGRLSPEEELARKVKSLMVGLGFQEMIFNYLSSAREFIHKMDPTASSQVTPEAAEAADRARIAAAKDRVLRIMNPMSENFEFVRPSILPSLLGAEAVSGNAVYPHAIFEVGKTAVPDEHENYGSRTINSLGLLYADAKAGFNQISSVVAALFYYLSFEYKPEVSEDPRFIPGRAVAIRDPETGADLGVFGEVHPGVLENWGITVPCTAAELDLDRLMKAGVRA